MVENQIPVDFEKYKTAARNTTLFVMNKARRSYYFEMINENSCDQKRLFKITKSFLHMSNQHPVIPPSVNKM